LITPTCDRSTRRAACATNHTSQTFDGTPIGTIYTDDPTKALQLPGQAPHIRFLSSRLIYNVIARLGRRAHAAYNTRPIHLSKSCRVGFRFAGSPGCAGLIVRVAFSAASNRRVPALVCLACGRPWVGRAACPAKWRAR